MKKILGILSMICICGVLILLPSLSRSSGQAASTNAASDKPAGAECNYPVAPGVWYPGDGPLPEKPMRYYRVRCWPGCHSGSAHGMYPDRELKMNPIFPTSTVPSHPPVSKGMK